MTGSSEDRKALRFPRTVIEPILHVAGAAGLDDSRDELLQRLGTTAEQFNQASFSLDGEQLLTLFHWWRERSAGHASVRQLLSRFSATSAGLVGMAALSASNVRESLLVAVRYLALLVPAMTAELVEKQRDVRLVLELNTDLDELNRFMIEAVAAAINSISRDVMSQPIHRTVHFCHGYSDSPSAQRHVRDLQQVFDCPIVFNSSFNGLQGYGRDLEVPTRSPNEATFSTVKRILEEEMAERAESRSFADIVKHDITRLANDGHFPALEAFAEQINQSPRTLVRKLAKEGTSFKQIANEVRFRLAMELLEKTRFPVKQVALRSGFANVSSFSRAFKAQAGMTPLAWRQQKHPGAAE